MSDLDFVCELDSLQGFWQDAGSVGKSPALTDAFCEFQNHGERSESTSAFLVFAVPQSNGRERSSLQISVLSVVN